MPPPPPPPSDSLCILRQGLTKSLRLILNSLHGPALELFISLPQPPEQMGLQAHTTRPKQSSIYPSVYPSILSLKSFTPGPSHASVHPLTVTCGSGGESRPGQSVLLEHQVCLQLLWGKTRTCPLGAQVKAQRAAGAQPRPLSTPCLTMRKTDTNDQTGKCRRRKKVTR